jgi:hypothetical protein
VKNDTKVPNPYEKDQATYFQSTGDGGIRCIGAAWSADPQTHVVICAPDITVLKRFWSKITNQPLDVKKAPILLYKYEPDKPEFKAPIEGKNLGNITKMKDHRINSVYMMWFFNDEKNQCYINFKGDSPKKEEIGPAVKMTVIECKLLLRSLGWKREDIDKLHINPTDPIPF